MFTDDKNLYLARKRDYLRSKLSVGKRLKAKLEANRIVDKQIALKKKEDYDAETKSIKSAWDDAMQTATVDMKSQGVLKRMTL